jgi:hypothetical protein
LVIPRYARLLLPALCLLLLLAGCSGSVTTNGTEVKNQAIIAATKAVHVAEIAATTVADSLTAQYKAGQVKREVLEQFQATIAPKISAALATARLALQTAQVSQETPKTVAVIQAVLSLQQEVAVLQGFWTNHVTVGVAP